MAADVTHCRQVSVCDKGQSARQARPRHDTSAAMIPEIPEKPEKVTSSMSLDILFEDEHLLAVSKPAGRTTQAPPIAGTTLETLVRTYLGSGDPTQAFAGTVHRLDRPVSGVVLWAKTSRDAHLMARQFERRTVRKEYWAVVPVPERGPDLRTGIWEDWLVREDTGLGRVQRCQPGTPRSQQARTRFESVAPVEPTSVISGLKLWPETGRMHQLRVQCGERNMPILGDKLYGSCYEFESQGIALHARRITFSHPRLTTPMTLEASLPESWSDRGWLQGLAWESRTESEL